MKIAKQLIVIDLETTGVWIDKDRIIEIAMIRIAPDGGETVYDKRVNPGIPIPPSVTELIGIGDTDVKEAPKFADIAEEVRGFFDGCDFAGFNVARFDLPVLRREMHDAGVKYDWESIKVIDVQRVYHLNEKRDLSAAYRFYCDKNLDNAHSAMADTRATLEILEAQVKRYGKGDDKLDSLNRFQYEQMAEFLDDERKFRWWNGKVYMMFGKYARKYSLQEVAQKDPGYLEWIASAKFSDEAKRIVTDALQGRFPVFKSSDKNG